MKFKLYFEVLHTFVIFFSFLAQNFSQTYLQIKSHLFNLIKNNFKIYKEKNMPSTLPIPEDIEQVQVNAFQVQTPNKLSFQQEIALKQTASSFIETFPTKQGQEKRPLKGHFDGVIDSFQHSYTHKLFQIMSCQMNFFDKVDHMLNSLTAATNKNLGQGYTVKCIEVIFVCFKDFLVRIQAEIPKSKLICQTAITLESINKKLEILGKNSGMLEYLTMIPSIPKRDERLSEDFQGSEELKKDLEMFNQQLFHVEPPKLHHLCSYDQKSFMSLRIPQAISERDENQAEQDDSMNNISLKEYNQNKFETVFVSDILEQQINEIRFEKEDKEPTIKVSDHDCESQLHGSLIMEGLSICSTRSLFDVRTTFNRILKKTRMSAKLNNRCRNYSKDAGESNLNNLIAG